MRRAHVLLIVLVSLACGSAPVEAASFDGVYNYAYNLNGPNGSETHSVSSGFIVKNGQITSNPSALKGSVDSNGNVYFTGPSPYGTPTAVFTGIISPDGSGQGDYQDSYGLRGKWSVSRVSGGDATDQIFDALFSIMYSFTPIGEVFGFTGGTAAGVGFAIVITPAIIILSALGQRSARIRREKQVKARAVYTRGQYEASQPDAPQSQHGVPPSAIGVPPPKSPPMGVDFKPPGLPERLVLRATWGRR